MRRVARWRIIGISFLFTLALAVLLCVTLLPSMQRAHFRRLLTNPDPQRRELGLNYLLRHGRQDPRLVVGAIRQLEHAQPDQFMQIATALNHPILGRWRRQPAGPVPDSLWIRWLELMSSEKSPDARIYAAQRLADMTDLVADPRLAPLLAPLIADDNADVRYNALMAAGEMAGAASAGSAPAEPYVTLIQSLTADPQPALAAEAWMILGLLHAPNDHLKGRSGRPIDVGDQWRTAPPIVAQAMLFACAYAHPDQPQPAIDALLDAQAEPAVRAMAAYALSSSADPTAGAALAKVLTDARAVSSRNQYVLWRATLSLPDDLASRSVGPIDSLWATLHKAQADAKLAQPVELAIIYRWARHRDLAGELALAAQSQPDRPTLIDSDLAALAVLEGSPVGKHEFQPIPEAPELARLALQAVTATPDVAELSALMLSDSAPVRDQACVVAADRLTPEQTAALIAQLLSDYNDHGKRSGAILAGLTGSSAELLLKKSQAEDVWEVQQVHRLGLWMQGHPSEADADMTGMLTRPDVPASTVLLAMLHKNDMRALEYLLNPRGEPRLDLFDLLHRQRWWRVLRRYLEPAGAPPLWLWADPDLEQFQITLLRDWFLLHRHRQLTPPETKKN